MSRQLLDIHLLLWWLSGDEHLPQQAIDQVMAPATEVFVSQALLWEMAIKCSLGKLRVDLAELEAQIPQQGFQWLPITNSHLLAVAKLHSNGEHRDPFDRLLVCQSQIEPMLLLTADRQLAGYGDSVQVL